MAYWHWLAALSVLFVVLERLWPRYQQPVLRKGIGTDLFYLVFNGHFLGVGLAMLTTPLLRHIDAALDSAGAHGALYANVASSWPGWLQFLVAFVAIDFVHWCIHNMLHRVPALWTFHKVHHSIVDMDFIGSMRFHWGEVVIYKSLTYPVLAFFGFGGGPLMTLAVIATTIGHFNHANLRWRIGPLKYLFNNPEMHIWHHNRVDEGPPLYNFAINLSLWDWVFGTAHLPPTPPPSLGFEGLETFPRTVPGQLLHPLPAERLVRGERP